LLLRSYSNIIHSMTTSVKSTISAIKACSKRVFKELGTGWQEFIYQNAMEVALRTEHIAYETQRNLPITFMGHVVGESKPDLIVWVTKGSKKTAIVIDLKADSSIKEDHSVQVQRYIKELRKQVRKNQVVCSTGLLINFFKEYTGKKIEDGFEDLGGVQILEVKV
jgi:GxxExxY protein